MNLVLLIISPIFCTTAVSYALYDIYKYFKFSNYPPRLLLIVFTILGEYPISFFNPIVHAINQPIFRNPSVCYITTAINWLFLFKVGGLISLSILVGIIIFTKTDRNTVNKIGKQMVYATILYVAIFQIIILPFSGASPENKREIRGKPYFRICQPTNKTIRFFYNVIESFSSTLTLILAVIIFGYNIVIKRKGKEANFNRITLSFLFFSLIGFSGNIRYFIHHILRLSISPIIDGYISDITRMSSGFFALVYILIEARSRNINRSLSINEILGIPTARILFSEYLRRIGMGENCKWIDEWVIAKNKNLSHDKQTGVRMFPPEKTLGDIEKTLDLELYGFFMTEDWDDFYKKYKKIGEIEARLMKNEG